MSSKQFQALHEAMRAQVDQGFLPGVSTALLRGREVVDQFLYGHADIEAGTPLREDHIFRVFSNTKLITSCAVLLLMEEGKLDLDDAVERWIPALANPRVLRPGAMHIDDVESARTPITVRHLLTHTSGLSYGRFDPGTVLSAAFRDAGVYTPTHSLTQMIETAARLPLSFQPGTHWEYSIATDVLGLLIERLSGESLGTFFSRRIFMPLGMVDTAFSVPAEKQGRFCALYGGVDWTDPSKPGLNRLDETPAPGAYLRPPVRESGGGGLVSTLGDTVRLIQALMPGGPTLLKPETLKLMSQSHIAPGLHVNFPGMPVNRGQAFGLTSSVLLSPGANNPAEAVDEIGWGGLAGTMWWINPRLNIAGVLMTQRYMGFGNPYSFEFRREAYRALLAP